MGRRTPSPPTHITDELLPAATYLTGPESAAVLRVPIEAAGGVLHAVRPRHVQYRPGSDLIVRYSTDVSWNGKPAVRETHVASTTTSGPHEGAVPVSAQIDGEHVEVGVWQWPFDPVLTGLNAAVNPATAAGLCGLTLGPETAVQVVSYRPTERAVIRVGSSADECFIKVVPPGCVNRLVTRHRLALEAGIPVPAVRETFADIGLVVLEGLRGTTLRDGLKSGSGWWPASTEFDRLAKRFATVDLSDDQPVARRIDHARLHAAMLTDVLPDEEHRLRKICTALATIDRPADQVTIHGDLHEGQLVIDRGRITGVLDIDDMGTGAPIDDRATALAFLRYRALTKPRHWNRINGYAEALRRDSSTSFDLDQLDAATAAVLVGLATGPFRVQQPDWAATVQRVLRSAESHITRRTRP